jgi:aarF domain-containing kinase
MVSEWIDGFKITDSEKMNAYNFSKKNVMHDLVRAFAEQIFVSGFIHCDPHPGNIFVRPNPNNIKKHQLVILDFGLSLEISEKFRLEYANFWKSMFINDVNYELFRKME